MSDRERLLELSASINHQESVLADLMTFLTGYVEQNDQTDRVRGLVVAGVLENYYTAAETVLFRIAQEFGNEVSAERWHADLLRRLNVAVPGVRPRVLSDETFRRLDELRRFRHFKRYYYQIDFDRDKLGFLVSNTTQLHPVLTKDLQNVIHFIEGVDATQ